MGKLFAFFCAILCVVLGNVSHSVWQIFYTVPSRPNSADESPWWGPGEPKREEVKIKNFIVNVSDLVSPIIFLWYHGQLISNLLICLLLIFE